MGEEWSDTDIIRTLPVRKKEGNNVVQAMVAAVTQHCSLILVLNDDA